MPDMAGLDRAGRSLSQPAGLARHQQDREAWWREEHQVKIAFSTAIWTAVAVSRWSSRKSLVDPLDEALVVAELIELVTELQLERPGI
ncbi:hypothetical protein GCM10009733_006740 [Nonomuraea maheshkhaliensis]|uniref:Uncharacterized protein n=1 Tax=Nonomuraea maheshkhaliensis TaxID=419590 RepID=A0ABP4QJ73_9ACTN